jgi:hypothetical protein
MSSTLSICGSLPLDRDLEAIQNAEDIIEIGLVFAAEAKKEENHEIIVRDQDCYVDRFDGRSCEWGNLHGCLLFSVAKLQ